MPHGRATDFRLYGTWKTHGLPCLHSIWKTHGLKRSKVLRTTGTVPTPVQRYGSGMALPQATDWCAVRQFATAPSTPWPTACGSSDRAFLHFAEYFNTQLMSAKPAGGRDVQHVRSMRSKLRSAKPVAEPPQVCETGGGAAQFRIRGIERQHPQLPPRRQRQLATARCGQSTQKWGKGPNKPLWNGFPGGSDPSAEVTD
jgi:hypothetical protein